MPSLKERRKKRYICTFVKKDEKSDEFKGNLVVVAANNDVMAQVILCRTQNIPPVKIIPIYGKPYTEEGYKSIRLSETNTYEGGDPRYDNFSDDS